MDSIELACYAMRKDSYISYTTDFLSSPKESAETLLIKKDLFEKLSDESKKIINILLNSPQEINNLTILREYLYNEGISYRKCSKLFKEIKGFIKELTDV